MKIAVDFSWAGPSGIGRMMSEVLSRKSADVDIIRIHEGQANAAPLTPLKLSLSIRKSKSEKFWSPGFVPPLTSFGTPCAITIHDLTHLYYFHAKHRIYYNAVIRPLLKNVDVIFTVSDHARADILQWTGLPENKVVRVYNGVDPTFSADGPRTDIGRPYILYIGNRRLNKNVDGLMRGFAESGLAREGFMLGLTGARDEAMMALERQFGIAGHVHYFGFVDEADLPSLYRGAHLVAFPSLYEGFGLPVIEGMACGTPVLTSNVSCLPEVAGGAALLVNPYESTDIAAGLQRLCHDTVLRETLRTDGLRRASQFSWEHTARGYWDVLERL
jgi:glycosyltransferase involved in cell wall biosynthesis